MAGMPSVALLRMDGAGLFFCAVVSPSFDVCSGLFRGVGGERSGVGDSDSGERFSFDQLFRLLFVAWRDSCCGAFFADRVRMEGRTWRSVACSVDRDCVFGMYGSGELVAGNQLRFYASSPRCR